MEKVKFVKTFEKAVEIFSGPSDLERRQEDYYCPVCDAVTVHRWGPPKLFDTFRCFVCGILRVDTAIPIARTKKEFLENVSAFRKD